MPVAMVPWPGERGRWSGCCNPGEGGGEMCVEKDHDATHEISHLSHVRDATNAISQETMVSIIPSPSCQFMKTGPTAMNLRR